MLFLIILLLTAIATYVLPWWACALIAFAAALVWGKAPGKAFLAGFLGVFVAWVLVAIIKSAPNDNILASRVSHLFHLPHWIFVLLFSAIIGGLVGGMSALSGQLVKKALTKK